MEKNLIQLLNKAKEAKMASYSPYSGFSVGAALLCEDGSVYKGCNIENASYTPTCCAERVAIFSAIVDRKEKFSAIAIVGDTSPCPPCGVCRQVMSEFCDDNFEVITEDSDGKPIIYTFGELLPSRFKI